MNVEMLKNVETSGVKYVKSEVYKLDKKLATDWINAGYAEKTNKKPE